MPPLHEPKKWFDFTINPTNIAVAVGFLTAIGIFLVNLRDDIRTTNFNLKEIVVELRNDNKLQDQIITQLKLDWASSKSDESVFRGEMRNAIIELQRTLTGIQIQAAKESLLKK